MEEVYAADPQIIHGDFHGEFPSDTEVRPAHCGVPEPAGYIANYAGQWLSSSEGDLVQDITSSFARTDLGPAQVRVAAAGDRCRSWVVTFADGAVLEQSVALETGHRRIGDDMTLLRLDGTIADADGTVRSGSTYNSYVTDGDRVIFLAYTSGSPDRQEFVSVVEAAYAVQHEALSG